MKLTINGRTVEVRARAKTRLLWVLRDELGLTGTKFGCGMGLCGSCLVHLAGKPVKSCLVPIEVVGNRAVTTIEGLARGDELHPVQRAWLEHEVIQCGYCQPGQIMAAAALIAQHPHPSDAEIDEAMSGVLCRCGTYERIRTAIKTAAGMKAGAGKGGT